MPATAVPPTPPVTASTVLILGGVRAGKSGYAIARAQALAGPVAFVATAEGRDDEMAARIARHRASRPAPWTTIEAPLEVAPALEALRGQAAVVIVDCLTLWVANLLGQSPGLEDEQLLADLARVSDAIGRGGFHALMVSNEVGSGVHPATALGRRYRDLLGLANQAVARVADEVVLMIAGCPTWVKGAQ